MITKWIRSATAGLLTLLMLASCAQNPNEVQQTTTTPQEVTTTEAIAEATTTTEATSSVPETDPIADAPVLDVVKNGQTSFKIIRADKASDEIAVASLQLRKALNEATGANIGISSEQSNKNSNGEREILIGLTNRAVSKEAKAALSGEMFGIKVTENGIVIAATHEDFIPLAVDYFMEHYLENNEYVTISDGTYSISTAASVTCKGILADLTDIRLDTEYATISQLHGTINKDGNFKALQGGCVTDKYAYMAVLNTTDYDTEDAGCYVYKFDRETWRLVRRSGVLMMAHANDITYNPNTNQLFVAHCYVDSTKISILDADTLKLVGTIHTDKGVYALDYHAPTNTFIGGRGKSGTLFFRYSPKGDRLLMVGQITPMPTQMVTQGICRDDKYAYHVMFSTSAEEPNNTIIIYDLEKKTLAHNVRLSISDQEPENISLVDGVFYIGCNSKSGSNKLDVYKTVLYEFRFDEAQPWN